MPLTLCGTKLSLATLSAYVTGVAPGCPRRACPAGPTRAADPGPCHGSWLFTRYARYVNGEDFSGREGFSVLYRRKSS
jgi:hypothetical protein